MTKVLNVLNRTEFRRREFKSPEPTPIKKGSSPQHCCTRCIYCTVYSSVLDPYSLYTDPRIQPKSEFVPGFSLFLYSACNFE